MTAIINYTTLQTAINEFSERSYSSTQLDGFIGLAEGLFRLYLAPHFAEQATANLAVASGTADLPAGFIRVLSLTHSTYGSLGAVELADLRSQQIWNSGGVPSVYALSGAAVGGEPLDFVGGGRLLTSGLYTGNLSLEYEGVLPGLTSSNATNWLITNAPQVYLDMCRAWAEDFEEDYDKSERFKEIALKGLSGLSIQSTVAQFGRASLRIAGPTP